MLKIGFSCRRYLIGLACSLFRTQGSANLRIELAVILIAVPEKSMGVRVGILVFAFWGICVAIHILAYALSSRRITKGYDSAVQKELKRMKREK